MSKNIFALFSAILALSLLSPVMALPAEDAAFNATLSDMGYKYPSGEFDSALYSEWWYFNMFDEKNNIHMMIAYEIDNPDNATGGLPYAAVVMTNAYTPNADVSEDNYVENFVLSEQTLNVVMDQSNITGINNNTVRMQGRTPDGKLVWDLTYSRVTLSYINYPLTGFTRLSVMPRIVYMPTAYVNGKVTIDGTTYQVKNAKGEFEQEWGAPLFFNLQPWGQMGIPKDKFQLDMFNNLRDEHLKVVYNSQFIQFSNPTFVPLSFETDVNVGLYPAKYYVTASNYDYKIEFVTEELNNHNRRWSFSTPFIDGINSSFLEASYQYTGTLYEKYGILHLRERPIYSFNSVGIFEFSKTITLG